MSVLLRLIVFSLLQPVCCRVVGLSWFSTASCPTCPTNAAYTYWQPVVRPGVLTRVRENRIAGRACQQAVETDVAVCSATLQLTRLLQLLHANPTHHALHDNGASEQLTISLLFLF